MKLVSKKLLGVFTSYSELSSSIVLGAGFEEFRMINLLGCLYTRRQTIQSITTYCDSATLNIVLGALVCPTSQLTYVMLQEPNNATLMLLAAIPSLSTCVLTLVRGWTDLSPLSACYRMKQLVLRYGQNSMR